MVSNWVVRPCVSLMLLQGGLSTGLNIAGTGEYIQCGIGPGYIATPQTALRFANRKLTVHVIRSMHLSLLRLRLHVGVLPEDLMGPAVQLKRWIS